MTESYSNGEVLSTMGVLHRLAHYLCRLAPGISLYGLLGLSTLLIFIDPRGFFLISTLFITYNLYMMAHVGWYSFKGYRIWAGEERKDTVKEHHRERKAILRDNAVNSSELLAWNDVMHYVLIPNYKEHASILSETIGTLSKSIGYSPKRSMVIVLAMEEREPDAVQKAMDLIAKHSENFLDMMYTLHPKDLPGERPGKGSNDLWAMEQVNQDVKRRGWEPNNVCITICDADSNVNPKHFAYLHGKFCNDLDRDVKIWQAPIVCFRNYDTVPAPTRMMAQAVSMHEIACLADERDVHIPFSTYSMSLNYINLVKFDKNVIPEDWHIFLKGYFRTGGRARLESIPFPVTCYAVESDTWENSVVERYTQAKRHAWGVCEITFVLREILDHYIFNRYPNIGKPDPMRTFRMLWKIVSIHMIAGASTYFVTIPGLVLFLYMVHPYFASQPEAVLLTTQWSILYQYLNMATVLPLLLTGFAHYKILTRIIGKQRGPLLKQIFWNIQFAVSAVLVNFIFAMVPTIWACTRLIKSEDFSHIVAPKPELQRTQSELAQDDLSTDIV